MFKRSLSICMWAMVTKKKKNSPLTLSDSQFHLVLEFLSLKNKSIWKRHICLRWVRKTVSLKPILGKIKACPVLLATLAGGPCDETEP